MQLVFLGEADRAMRLMREPGGDARSLSRARLGGADQQRVKPMRQRVRGHVGGGDRGGGLAGQDSKVLLDRLELADRSAELHPDLRVLHAERQGAGQRAGNLHRAHRGARCA